MSIKVSLCITTYNRSEKLKACLNSFMMTNVYPWKNIELIIVDNGSTEPSALGLVHNMEVEGFKAFTRIINGKNDYPYCLRRAKNQARAIAKGEYFIDCPDDHLFVVRYDWISEGIKYLEEEKEKVSAICHYAYPHYRFDKPSNEIEPSKVNDNFFLTPKKAYADYHIMKRETYNTIGKYNETLELSPSSETDYMERSQELGYKRALYKYPVSIIIDKDTGWPGMYAELEASLEGESYKSHEFTKSLNRPLTNEELTQFAIDSGCLRAFELPEGVL